MRSWGSVSRASANLTRCCSPPEHRDTWRRATSASPVRAITLPTREVAPCKAAIALIVSSTLRSRSRPPVWSTVPILPCMMALRGASPNTSIVPDVGEVSPSSMSRVVVFPAPLGPRKATISPGLMVTSIPATASTRPSGLRKLLCTRCSSMAFMTSTLQQATGNGLGGTSRCGHDKSHNMQQGSGAPPDSLRE